LKRVQVAIASGKGGTGKTTLAVSLALSAPERIVLADCDVEEPNCHLFLRPEIEHREPVSIPVPVVDETECTLCGACSEACQFGAIVALKTRPLVFPELCHGCGGCALACPVGAISETPKVIGDIAVGRAGSLRTVQGRLNVGEALSPPVIRAARAAAKGREITLIDAPPGTACPMVAAVKASDAAVLVTEPTPFGLHDLELAVDTMRVLAIPFAVVINRSDVGDGRVAEYCTTERIDVLAEIPEDRRVAEAYSRGRPALEAGPGYARLFADLMQKVAALAAGSGADHG
jgi:MinD superfamily P-loop ATPase